MHDFLKKPGYSPTDRHFADMLSRKAKVTETNLLAAFADLSATLGNQNSCLAIEDPDLAAQLKTLDCVATDSTSAKPLVLVETENGHLLYTHRFHQYETRIAADLIARNRFVASPAEQFTALQPYLEDQDDPQQQLAAIQAVTRQLTIITGGPGTGKTSTVVKILAGLLNHSPELNIALAAPTGKAAMRLSESIQGAISKLPDSKLSSAAPIEIPTKVRTLHRLLGVRGDGQSFRHNKNHPLPIDVLILDEGSMIDLVMFDRVLAALPKTTRLIILGDPDQLPSVDSGNVLADITSQGSCYSSDCRSVLKEIANIDIPGDNASHLLADAHCQLVTSFRFDDKKGIGQLAADLRQGHPLTLKDSDEVSFRSGFDPESVLKEMDALFQPYLQLCQESEDPNELIQGFDKARLLTPVRDGEFGVNELNLAFEAAQFPDTPDYYHGKPIMIMSNHYALRLFNGDIGICIQRGDKVEVAFRNASGEVEYYLPTRLPPHSSCFAMTVHKSQGSEFDQVLLLVPETSREDFVSRELLYTGITRTRSQLTIFHNQNLEDAAPHTRTSGLAQRFRNAPDHHEPPSEGKDQLQLDF